MSPVNTRHTGHSPEKNL